MPFGKSKEEELPEEEEYTYGEVEGGGGEDEIVVDWTKVGLIPTAGAYLVEVRNAKTRHAKSSGDLMVALTLSIVQPEDYLGVYVFDNLMMEGPGRNRTKKAFEEIFGSAVERFRLSDFVGKQFWVQLTPESDPEYGDRAQVSGYGV